MLALVGALMGLIVAFIGSLVLSVYPYLPFGLIFLASVGPSILIFIIVSYLIKTEATKLYYWVYGFVSLFIIGNLSFFLKNYFEAKAITASSGSSLNWDVVILFNIIYSLGAALLLSPLSMYAIQRLAKYKEEKFGRTV